MGVCQGILKERHVALCDMVNRFLLQQVGIEFKATLQTSFRFRCSEHQIKLRLACDRRNRLDFQCPKSIMLLLLRMEGEHRLEDGILAEVSLKVKVFHEKVEGHVLMSKGVQAHLFDMLHVLKNTLISVVTNSKGQRVDKKTDERLYVSRLSAGNGDPYTKICLACVTRQ
ncbi:MAG: hypothetical protein MUC50_08280 [Myxococcota bacterium]|nr:hypothetical protein [Myxococcota bacterium]